jgi:hypothetical protein
MLGHIKIFIKVVCATDSKVDVVRYGKKVSTSFSTDHYAAAYWDDAGPPCLPQIANTIGADSAILWLSERIAVGLACSNAQRVIEWHYKNLAIANLASLGRCLDCGHNAIRLIVVDRDFNADLGEETDRVFNPR